MSKPLTREERDRLIYFYAGEPLDASSVVPVGTLRRYEATVRALELGERGRFRAGLERIERMSLDPRARRIASDALKTPG